MPRYANTPGVDLVLVNNGISTIDHSPRTDSVLIIGPAVDGPVDRVVKLRLLSANVEDIYGPMRFNSQYTGPASETSGFNGNHLVKSFREVQKGGCQDIWMLRVGGTTASGTHTNGGSVSGTLIAVAQNPGRIYNQVSVAFTSGAASGQVVVTQPTAKGGSFTISWSGTASGKTVQTIVNEVNSDPRNTTIRLFIGTVASTGVARLLHGSVTLSSGTDGTDADDYATSRVNLYSALTDSTTGALEIARDETPDIVLLSGIYADDACNLSDNTVSIMTSFTTWLGDRALDYPILGFMGLRPLENFSTPSLRTSHYSAITSTTAAFRSTTVLAPGYFVGTGFTYSDTAIQESVDAGGRLVVVAADAVMTDNDLGRYIDTAAGIAAGQVAAMRGSEPLTYKNIPGIEKLAWRFKPSEINTILGGLGASANTGVAGGGGYLVGTYIPDKGYVWVKDITCAQRTSDYSDIQSVRIGMKVQKGLRAIATQYIGKPYDPPHRQALETACKTYMTGLYELGYLWGPDEQGFDLKVQGMQNPLELTTGRVVIDVRFIPVGQIKVIEIRVDRTSTQI